ncbi:MAG: 2-C-methyl-D-erythritol 4-phosphate cytidylyltransferase [Mucilaginibacter sp.]
MTSADPTLRNPYLASKKYVIIVGGGTGTRMQSIVPKQFLPFSGKTVLMHTINAFSTSAVTPEIILVLPSAYHAFWKQLCVEHQFITPHQLVAGGETRFHSVKNGLDSIDDNIHALIAVHDAVRPLTSQFIIENSYQIAAESGNAITAVKSRDSVRLMENGVSKSLLRDNVYLVQTPQTFQSAQLKKAYRQAYNIKFTDDASVVEELGIKINLAEGDHRNIKITFPEDIAIAEMLLRDCS